MKVFRIRLNSNEFQSFLPADPETWNGDMLKMDCRPKLSTWEPPKVYVPNPKLRQGHFYHLCAGAFVVDAPTCEKLRTILEAAGELLPLPYQDATYTLLNVLECVNCLDERNTKWVMGKRTRAKIRITEYHFNPSRIPESTLFKIPESGEILTVSGIKDPEEEFKSAVERERLQGLMFEELWSE